MIDNDKKIMLLQLKKQRKALHIKLRGELYQKSNRGFKRAQAELIRQIKDSANKFNWNMIPRARIAVKIQFFPSNDSQAPAIQNLVKTYLDMLNGIAFKDDRQISYLSAYCYRNDRSAENTHSKDGDVYIKVEKFADLLERYKLYHELKGELNSEYELEYRHNFRRDYDDAGDEVSLGDIAEKLNIEPAKVAELKRYDKIEKQLNRLSLLDDGDWPGVLKNPYLHALCGDLEEHFPFCFHIDGIMFSDQKKQSETAILKKFKTYSSKFSQGKILSPIELDIQVRTRNRLLTKDLDNIVKNILPILQKHVLSDKSFIYGYRIYLVDNPCTNSDLKGLRIKIAPPFSISDYESMIDEIIEKGEEWLEQSINL